MWKGIYILLKTVDPTTYRTSAISTNNYEIGSLMAMDLV